MLTICPRCRTPYDRRDGALAALPAGDAVRCAGCRTGSSADTRVPVLVPFPVLSEADAMPATVLPVAS
jgi:hypothetical protein